MADLARRATRWVGTFPYILTPIPNLYDHSFPRYGQITFLTFRRPMTLTFDLKFWKYLSVTVYPYVICMPSFIMIGWEMAEILHFEILRKHGQTNTQTHKHTNKQTPNRHGHYNTSPSPYGGRGNNFTKWAHCKCKWHQTGFVGQQLSPLSQQNNLSPHLSTGYTLLICSIPLCTSLSGLYLIVLSSVRHIISNQTYNIVHLTDLAMKMDREFMGLSATKFGMTVNGVGQGIWKQWRE